MTIDEALDAATASFATTLGVVTEPQWPQPSINPGWSVRDLVNHVVGGNCRYVLLLSGAPTPEVEALRDLDHLGTDPQRAFAETSAAVVRAFAEPGVRDRVVHHRRGDRTGRELLVMRVMEHSLHGWDLARSIAATDQVDDDVARAVLIAVDADPTLIPRAGYPSYDGPPASDPATRLLQLTGRRH